MKWAWLILVCACAWSFVAGVPQGRGHGNNNNNNNNRGNDNNRGNNNNNRGNNNNNRGNDNNRGKGQEKKKDDNKGGRLLVLPEPELCAERPKQWQFLGHNYYFSWDQEAYLGVFPRKQKVDWLKARNECRLRCMDAVGMETTDENDMIFELMRQRNLTYIWTSGRLCDFTGCESREDLKPINILGWFWSNTNTKIAPTDKTPPGWAKKPWSNTGHNKLPQPDNAEFGINRTPESCLAVLNNLYKDGIAWHDIACYHKKPYVCEDSDALLQWAQSQAPHLSII